MSNVKHGSKMLDVVYMISSAIGISLSSSGCNFFLGHWGVNQPSKLSIFSWYPPPHDWIKGNIDGALLNLSEAGIAKVFRNHKGRFLLAFGFKYIH